MREILFRARVIDSKSFITGFLIKQNVIRKYYKSGHVDLLVIPETIGQFTGLLDKNGNKIFEGDKFKPDESIEEVKCIVRWDYEFSKFVVDSYGYNFHIGEGSQEVYDNELSIVDTCDLADMILEYCEIIGNIHDVK